MSATKPMKPVTFEAGAMAVEEAMRGKGVEGYYADAADPLHAAFPAKARIHSGPDCMPLMGESAREALERLADRPRSGKTLAYLHIPFCETRCLYCMFYQNPFDEDRS